MPKGAKGFKPGPRARRFFWSIGEKDGSGDVRRGACTIVWRRVQWRPDRWWICCSLAVPFELPQQVESGFDHQSDQRKTELGIIASLSRSSKPLRLRMPGGGSERREEATSKQAANPRKKSDGSQFSPSPPLLLVVFERG